MQNAMMDLFKQLNDNAMSSAKRVGELNMKTFETLTAKQTALLTSCFEAGTKNADALSKAKDPKEVFAMQQEVLKSCGEKWLANVREAAELLTATRDELVAIAEEAALYHRVLPAALCGAAGRPQISRPPREAAGGARRGRHHRQRPGSDRARPHVRPRMLRGPAHDR